MLPAAASDVILAALRPLGATVVYGFGSRFRGQARPDSDWDIAFWSDAPCSQVRLFNLASELAEALGAEQVDLVDLSAASTVMAAQVIRTGTVLWEESTARRAAREWRVLSDYARLNEERAPVLARWRAA